MTVKIGTRQSRLALVQTEMFAQRYQVEAAAARAGQYNFSRHIVDISSFISAEQSSGRHSPRSIVPFLSETVSRITSPNISL